MLNKKKKYAFTLVEVIVTSMMILWLSASVLPTFFKTDDGTLRLEIALQKCQIQEALSVYIFLEGGNFPLSVDELFKTGYLFGENVSPKGRKYIFTENYEVVEEVNVQQSKI